MPRVRCPAHTCIHWKGGYCSSEEIELDMETLACLTMEEMEETMNEDDDIFDEDDFDDLDDLDEWDLVEDEDLLLERDEDDEWSF